MNTLLDYLEEHLLGPPRDAPDDRALHQEYLTSLPGEKKYTRVDTSQVTGAVSVRQYSLPHKVSP